MDLRIVKTKNVIKDAFLKLRKKNPLEKIKITELCNIALINKATFYKHYLDVYELSDELENGIVSAIIDNAENINSLFTDPQGFVTGLFSAVAVHKNTVDLLFGGRINILVSKIEERLKSIYTSNDDSPERAVTLSFYIGGTAHLMINSKYDPDLIIGVLTNIISSSKKP
ncbi:MAG: hypothetical protein LBP26_02565 [Clostridiales bacterium]|jgi:AcrR family transcriptional regulator|nr:hypothetical protein [Clostridiales bacterium]